MIAGQHLLQRLRMHLDTGHGIGEGRGAEIHEAGGARADQDVAAGDLGAVDRASEEIAR